MTNNSAAVIFDLDGVVIDTEPLYTKAEIKLFEEYGIYIPKEDWALFRGCSEQTFFDLSMERYGITEDRDVFMKKGRQYVMDEFNKNIPFMPGFKDLIDKIGIQRRVYTAGKNKSTLDPFLEEKKEDIERLKNIQLDLHKNFINVVENSRSIKLKKDAGIELFSGEFWSGNKALELGLIDGIGNANDILREKYGNNIIIKKFEKNKGWLARKLSSDSHTEKLINIVEEKSIWQKYGF